MKKSSITKFMIGEHGKMLTLFLNFKKNPNQETFDKLEFIKKRHVFAEEKAIMMLQSSDREFPEMLSILEQHKIIGETMGLVKTNFINKLGNYKQDLDKVINLMKKHVKFENEKFYPKLDKTLNEREKQVMFKEFENIYKDFERRQLKLEAERNMSLTSKILRWLGYGVLGAVIIAVVIYVFRFWR